MYARAESYGMNVPNAITSVRILLVPFLAYLLLHGAYGAAIWVFLAAGVSDALDGFIARRFNLCTRVGAVLDPLADKMLIVVSVLTLAWRGLLPWWLAFVIAGRDLIIVGGAAAYALRAGRVEMEPSVPSKVNTGVQITLVLVVLGTAAGVIRTAGWLPALFGIAFVTTVVSGVHYVVVWGLRAAAARKSG